MNSGAKIIVSRRQIKNGVNLDRTELIAPDRSIHQHWHWRSISPAPKIDASVAKFYNSRACRDYSGLTRKMCSHADKLTDISETESYMPVITVSCQG